MYTSVTLANGRKMPLLGLGTWQIENEADVRRSLTASWDAGYRMIDTARSYYNERFIGQVLKENENAGKIKREDIFITTKLSQIHMKNRDDVLKGIRHSLEALQVDYIDLYLIHNPVALKHCGDEEEFIPGVIETGTAVLEDTDLVTVWKVLEECVDDGRLRSIGVSNFTIAQTKRIVAAARHPVCVIQAELNLFFQQTPLVEYCRKNNIVVTSYASIGSPGKSAMILEGHEYPVLLEDQTLCSVASRLGKTPAQVAMRFLVQQGIIVIPKSVTPTRIVENSKLFDFVLSDDDMKTLKAMDRNMRTFFMSWGSKHPEYPFW